MKFPVHPIVFLEPVVHLILGAALLARSPFDHPALRLGVGGVFVLLGFAWAIPAVRRYRFGAFALSGDFLSVRGGAFAARRRQLERNAVSGVEARRGARALRFDPVHALLARWVRYGSVEVQTSDGGRQVIHPVQPERAADAIDQWAKRTARPSPPRQSRALLPGVSGLVFASFAAAVLLADDRARGPALVVLLVGATIAEAGFWLSIVAAFRRSDAG